MTTQTVPDQRVPVPWLVLLATPAALSANATTTVIPALAHDLGVSAGVATWTATAFGWAALAGTPVTAGLLRDRGPRFVLLLNGVLVLAGTLLVLVAPGLPVLLAGRAVQALGGGGLVVLGYGLAGTAQRTGAIAASFGLVGAFGPLSGAVLAGASWRAALCLSLLALLAVPMVLRRMPARPDVARRNPGDPFGLVLVLALVSALVLIPRFPLVTFAALGAVVLLALHVRRRPDGFVPLTVLRANVFRTAAVAACMLSTSYFVLLYTVPRLLEREWSPGRIGVATLLALAAGSAASLVIARYTARFAPTAMRLALAVTGGVAVVLPLVTPWPVSWAAALAFSVFASGTAMGWYASRAISAVPVADRAVALGLFTLCYQLGGAAGPAVATLMIG